MCPRDARGTEVRLNYDQNAPESRTTERSESLLPLRGDSIANVSTRTVIGPHSAGRIIVRGRSPTRHSLTLRAVAARAGAPGERRRAISP